MKSKDTYFAEDITAEDVLCMLDSIETSGIAPRKVLCTPIETATEEARNAWFVDFVNENPNHATNDLVALADMIWKIINTNGARAVKPASGGINPSVAKAITAGGYLLLDTTIGGNRRATVQISTSVGLIVVYADETLLGELCAFADGIGALKQTPKPSLMARLFNFLGK